MKANEFVKKFGWDKAKEVAGFTSNVCEDPTHFDSDLDIYVHFDDFKGVMDESDVCIGDLKRIVESHRLIEVEGGIDQVKDTFSFAYKHGVDELTEYGKRLNQAILDVESCQ